MPVILCQDLEDIWLNLGKTELTPIPADEMKVWPVSERVNSPRQDTSELAAPLP